MARKKADKKETKVEKVPYAANSGRGMNKTGIVGDGCLVKKRKD